MAYRRSAPLVRTFDLWILRSSTFLEGQVHKNGLRAMASVQAKVANVSPLLHSGDHILLQEGFAFD